MTKEYYQAHKEERKAYIRAYQKAHPERVKIWQAKHYLKHKVKRNAQTLAYYNSHKEQYKRDMKRRVGRNRDLMIQLKSNPCTDCKTNYPWFIMQWDHLSDKKYEVKALVYGGAGIAKIQSEIAKCELVCPNCHALRTYARKQHLPMEKAA